MARIVFQFQESVGLKSYEIDSNWHYFEIINILILWLSAIKHHFYFNILIF